MDRRRWNYPRLQEQDSQRKAATSDVAAGLRGAIPPQAGGKQITVGVSGP